jgi:hypothetical protein
MAIIDLPNTRGFQGAQFSLGLDVSQSSFTGFLTGNRTRTSNLVDRLRGVLTLPPTRDRATAAIREAILFGMHSSGDVLRMGIPHRLTPAGTLRGSPTVLVNVAAGARRMVLQDGRAGANLLRSADLTSTALTDGWSTLNATVTAAAAPDPDGGNTAWLLSRAATGNHYAMRTVAMAATANRTVAAYVWIKAGTLVGEVVLRLRDGADSEIASRVITPTSTWTVCRIAGTFGGASAANVRFYIDPAIDAGSAGETLQVWYSEVRALTGVDTLCTASFESDVAPAGMPGWSDVVTRSGAGNAYTLWSYSTTAHASRTFTFSAYLKAGTFTGSVILRIRDGSNAVDLATSTLALSGAWQRISASVTFGASPTAGIICFLDQTDAGSVGETYSRYGVQLEAGSSPTDFTSVPTAAAGDFFSVAGNLLQVAYPGATGDVTGAMTLPLTLPAPKAMTAGATVECTLPTGLWELDDDGLQLDYSAGNVQSGIAIPLRQVVL